MEVAEKICDDICLINRSQKVLDGSLREIKKSFGRNAIALRMEGSNGILNDPTLVSNVRTHSDELEVLLAPSATAQQFLCKLVDSGANVSKFEMIEPSLHDIFIQKVTEGE
jgi:ABC-2 type transport system ATP-binding protein